MTRTDRRLPAILATLVLLAAAAIALAMFMTPAQAQEGDTVPAKPTGLTADVSHDRIVLTWDDPDDASITGYVILRRNRNIHAEGQFSTLVEDTETAATTYTDTAVEAETPYTYRVKAINENGESERSRWVHTETLAAPAPEPTPESNTPATGAPAVSGTHRVGETLTADTSAIADEDGLDNASFTYQWLAGDTDIQDATDSTYTLTADNVGKAIKVKVSFTDDAGNEETLTSTATEPVADAEPTEPPAKPSTLTAPEVAHDSVTLTWRDPEDNTITGYIILRRDKDIHEEGTFETVEANTGTADTTYTDTSVYPEKRYVYRIKAINAYDESEISNWVRAYTPAAPTTEQNTPATGAPTISGTARVGETLSADTSGIADEDGLSNVQYEHQWLADDEDISGTTGGSYTLASADKGKTIKVRVSFTDDASNEETLTSAATAEVASAPSPEPPARPTGLVAQVLHDRIILDWDDPGDQSVTGYTILRYDRDHDADAGMAEHVPDTGAATASYTDETVAANSRYTYRIRALNDAGASDRSTYLHLYTPHAPGADAPAVNEPEDGDCSRDALTLCYIPVEGLATGNRQPAPAARARLVPDRRAGGRRHLPDCGPRADQRRRHPAEPPPAAHRRRLRQPGGQP